MSFIIPAIDLIGGRCVRLTEGDFQTSKEYDLSPLEQAKEFEAHGATRLHLVDLDGARAGASQQFEILEEIAEQTELAVEFSGGIRDRAAIQRALAAGAQRVSLGSAAIKKPEFLIESLGEFSAQRVIAACDIRGSSLASSKLAVNGWQTELDLTLDSFLSVVFASVKLKTLAVTDINRDGKLEGPSVGLYAELREKYPDLELIASGGVSSEADLSALNELGLSGAIVGKAFYEGRLSMELLGKSDYVAIRDGANAS
ncbi:UNVERIFIED_CONTAM: hypothetical protein GTU68_044941 [Idotea baltica]|nr:hypothetical protein [Idotea baltica]